MKKGAFLFDLDGVLVDTAVFHFRAWLQLSRTLGFEIDEHFNEKLKGISRMASLDLILEHGGITKTQEEKEALATQKNQWYLELVNQMTPHDILPGVEKFLQQCITLKIPMAVCSASKNASHILEKIAIRQYFTAVIDGNMVSKSKPDPEVFLEGAEALAISSEYCVVFEDAFAGITAAKSAGMMGVGIGTHKSLPNADQVVSGFKGHDPEEFLLLLPQI